jgi:hypothetical protein
MRCTRYFAIACAALGCGWPATRMEPVADYGSGPRATVSAAPAYTAGPDYQLTYSPDGSTLFVCVDGATEPGWRVPPDAVPAC